MMLNAAEIYSRGLISSGFDAKYLRDASYDVRIRSLIHKDSVGTLGQSEEEVPIEPQGIVAVVSRETITLPNDVCAYASIRTSLSRIGLLAINVGIVDPGWSGPVSSLVMNFGQNTQWLKTSDVFLRLTFHQIDDLGQKPTPAVDPAKYDAELRSTFNRHMGPTFMNVVERMTKQLNDGIRSSILKNVPLAAIVVTLMALVINYGTLKLENRLTPSEAVTSRAKVLTDEVDKRVALNELQNAQLKQQVEQLTKRVDELEKRR
jgi:deoxycytidine triphosphate deaminase